MPEAAPGEGGPGQPRLGAGCAAVPAARAAWRGATPRRDRGRRQSRPGSRTQTHVRLPSSAVLSVEGAAGIPPSGKALTPS
jgi:hypothetical protein